MKIDTRSLLYIALIMLVVSLTLNVMVFLKVSDILKLLGK